MKIPVGYILAFLSGGALLLLFNFFESQKKSSVKVTSGLYPIIYKSIEDKQALLNSMTTNEGLINSYKKQLQAAQEQLMNLKLPSPAMIASAEPAAVLYEARNLRDQLQKAFDPTRLNAYKSSYDEQSAVESALSIIATELSNNFSWSFEILWSPNVYLTPDSLYLTPGGQAYINSLQEFLRDTASLKNRRDQLLTVLRSKSEQWDSLLSDVRTNKEKLAKDIEGLNTSLADIEQSSKDHMLMYVVIPLFGLIVVLLMVLPYIYKQNDSILAKLFEQKVILQIFTVFILVMAILLLGIGDKIKGETLGTLLGGISVYVLQRALDGREGNSGSRQV